MKLHWWQGGRQDGRRGALLGLLLLAFALRVYGLGRQSLWGDEGASYAYAVQPPASLLADVAAHDPHPPLYYLGLKAWLCLAGGEEFALRFLSLLPGMVTVALIFALGKRLAGERLGLAAAALAALNPFLIWYSQWARMYALVTALCLLSILLFLRLVGRPRAMTTAGYVAASLLALLSHYYAAFIILFENLLFLFWYASRSRGAMRHWIAAQGALGVGYLPWLALAWPALVWYQRGVAGQVNTLGMVGNYLARWPWGWSLEPSPALILTLALAPALLLGLARWYQRRCLALPLLYLAVPLAVGLLVSLRRPILEERQLLLTAPAYLLILAGGLAWPGRWLPLSLASALVVVGGSASSLGNLYFDPKYLRGGYGGLTREIADFAKEGDAVILNGESQIFLYDYHRERELPYYIVPDSLPLDEKRVAETLSSLGNQYRGLWLLMSATANYDPKGVVQSWLDRHYYLTSLSQVADGWLAYYKTTPSIPPPLIGKPIVFDDAIALKRYRLDAKRVESGGVLGIELEWSALRAVDDDYKVFLHLRDSADNLWGQRDAEPVAGRRPTSTWLAGEEIIDRHGLRLRPGTPPGRYHLVAGLYHPQRGRRLPAIQGGSRTSVEEVSLGEVEVVPPQTPASEGALGYTHRAGLALSDGLELLGYDLEERVAVGQWAHLIAFWRATRAAPADTELTIRLGRGAPQAQEFSFPLSRYPLRLWRKGEVVGAVYHFLVGRTWETGSYPLEIGLSGGDKKALPSPLHIVGRRRNYTPPTPQHRSDAPLGGLAKLIGYDLEGKAKPGGELRLTLYWQATALTQRDYLVFVHLVDAPGTIRAQHDGPPADGRASTPSWLEGEFIADEHRLKVDTAAPPGEYRLVVGLYEGRSGRRLTTPTGEDAIVLRSFDLGEGD